MSHRAAPPSAPPPPSFLPKHVTPPEIPHMMSSATAVSNPASNTGPSLSSTPRASQLSTGPKPLGMIRPHYSSQAKQKAFKSPLPRTMIPQQTTTSHFSNPSCRASSPRLRSSSIQSKAATARHITSTSAVNIRPPVAASKAREESSERRSSSPPPEADSSYGPFDIDPDALEETMRQYD
ncbi:hypothetical protein A0H81_01770 [Grifola frondosa]|uniref:Uncharacterized protein n=1 Tax=Grifola frondosa TaxID=5627 RepID=A0A1C7MMX2_GRIFR|nr:hypothetical protein A0H81_01770 [Grifola frondosa]